MKIAPSYISKERLIKKAADRSINRINDYTKISTAFRPEQSKVIKENIDSVARYAYRHNAEIEFQPKRLRPDTSKMLVYKRVLRYADSYDRPEPMAYMDRELVGSVLFSKDINSKDFMKTVRTEASKMLYNDKK